MLKFYFSGERTKSIFTGKKHKPLQNLLPDVFTFLHMNNQEKVNIQFIVNVYGIDLLMQHPKALSPPWVVYRECERSMNFWIRIEQKLASRTGNSNLHTAEYHHKYFFSVCLSPMKYFVLLFCIAPFIQKLIPSEINSALTVTSGTVTTVPISQFCQQKSGCKN